MDESNDRMPETDDALPDEPNDATAGESVSADATESMEDAAPVVGGAADLGEPYTPVGETFQTSASSSFPSKVAGMALTIPPIPTPKPSPSITCAAISR